MGSRGGREGREVVAVLVPVVLQVCLASSQVSMPRLWVTAEMAETAEGIVLGVAAGGIQRVVSATLGGLFGGLSPPSMP
jgi:hypothetical protein